MNRLLRLTRIAALAITAAIGFATFAPTQAEARQERGWVGGQGADHHYRPIRQVRREQRLHQRHYAPRRHYAPITMRPPIANPSIASNFIIGLRRSITSGRIIQLSATSSIAR